MNEKPRFFKSLLIVSERGVEAGSCERSVHALTTGYEDTRELEATGRKPGTHVCTVRAPTHGVATLLIQPAPRD